MRAVRIRPGGFMPQARNNVSRVYNDTRSELKKISWPSRDETVRLSIVVIVLSVAMAFLLGVVADWVFFNIYKLISGL